MHRYHGYDDLSYLQRGGSTGSEIGYESRNKRHYNKTPFSFGAFYRYADNKHRLEITSSLSRSSADYVRELSHTDGYQFMSTSHNGGLASNTEAVYSLKLPSNMNLSVGSRYSYNSSTSDLTQDGFTESDVDIHSHQVYVYGKFGWSNRGFSIIGSPGVRYYSTDNGTINESYCRWRGVISASQNITNNISANYTVSVDPAYPTLRDYSTVIQRIDEFSAQTGNPYLKQSLDMAHNFRVNISAGKFHVSPYAYYTYTNKPMLESWDYSENAGYFIRSLENGKY